MSGAIVPSAPLVAAEGLELSAFEDELMVSANAAHRWIARCMAAAGAPDLGALDARVLHTVNHRGQAKRLADICFTLNVEDAHLVNYALKKLVKADLVAAGKRGKETHYAATGHGDALCQRDRAVRETCLIETMAAMGGLENAEFGRAASVLRALSGLYDQAARAANAL